ncbi:MAG: hypothetical protein WCK51_15830 [Armatimonadota bacterium]
MKEYEASYAYRGVTYKIQGYELESDKPLLVVEPIGQRERIEANRSGFAEFATGHKFQGAENVTWWEKVDGKTTEYSFRNRREETLLPKGMDADLPPDDLTEAKRADLSMTQVFRHDIESREVPLSECKERAPDSFQEWHEELTRPKRPNGPDFD